MKEFLSNNISISLYSDNSTLYNALKERLVSFSQGEDLILLKDSFQIFTRENLSTDYLSLKLVEDNIPSLFFEIKPYRIIPFLFLKKKPDPELILSDLACIFIIETILIKDKKILANRKVLRQLASDIFAFWKDSLISFSMEEEKIPVNIKKEYDSVIRAFIRMKGKKKVELEFLYEICASGKSQFISKEEAQEIFGKEVIFYGVSEIDPLHMKVLEILSSYVKISILLSAPRLNLIKKDKLIEDNVKIKEVLPNWNILSKLLGEKKISEVERILDFNFLDIPKDAIFSFYESQEAHREIEFVGREILSLLDANNDDDFRLTKIKLILPSEDLHYPLLVSNIFDRMGIPFAFTKDIKKKKSPYFSAVGSLLKLAQSDFDKDSVFSLLYNPCFHPILEEMRIMIRPDIWNEIISKMNIAGFLDKLHRKKMGFRESNIMTWESLWTRLNYILIGNTSEDSIILDSGLQEEAYVFLEVSTSLLQDLIGFKEDFNTLSDFSKFFRILLDTYLSTSMRTNKSEDITRLNEKAQEKIYSILSNLENIEEEVEIILKEKLNFSLEDFTNILLGQMDSWIGGDSKVLKKGVVVGELLDVIDPTFEYVFLVGLDERRFGYYSNKFESIMTEDNIQSQKKDSSLKLKNYFYHIFNHNAKRYSFSYVSLDTIKDREFYPARELELIRSLIKTEDSNYNRIPLFSYLENKMPGIKKFEKETFDLIQLKEKESSIGNIKYSYPNWAENSDLTLSKEIDLLTSEKFLNSKLKTYFFRPSFEKNYSNAIGNLNLSINKFVNYLECPKKYFFEYSIHSEEEAEVLGELDSVDSLRNHQFIMEVLSILNTDTKRNSNKIIEKIFHSERFYKGEIPDGILGQLAEMRFKDYLDLFLLPFATEELFSKFKVIPNIKFSTDASKSLDSTIFSTPLLWGEEIKARADFILQEGDTIYITLLTSAKNVTDKKCINIGLTAYLIEKSTQIKKELSDFFGIKNLKILPAILHVPKNQKPSLIRGNFNNYPEEIFKSYWDSMLDSKFPASPFESKKQTCDYCIVNSICYGYQSETLLYLEEEKLDIKKLIKEQFTEENGEKAKPRKQKKI